MGKVRLEKSSGAMVRRPNAPMTVEDVRDNWKDIVSFATPLHHLTQADQLSQVWDAIRKMNNKDGENENELLTQTFSYTSNQVILYALAVGCSLRQPNALRFLYENHEQFSALPTFAVIPAQSLTMSIMSSGKLGISLDLVRILHGEQYVELYQPLPTSGTVTLKGKIVDVLDKGSGAVVIYDVEMFDETEKLIALNQFVIFSVGSGGFGGKKVSEQQRPALPPPQRQADQISRETTTIDQAALYRLTGDENPLHIDPSFASTAGFSRPILHGLCSFGYAARHVLHAYANDDPALFKAIKVRFTKPVEPGQTIETHMWREGNRIFFEAKVPESNQTILTGGYVDLHNVILNTNSPGAPQESSKSTTSSGTSLKAGATFDEINKRAKSQPELVKKVGAIIVFDITKDGKVQKSWTIDGKKGTINEGKPQEGTTAQVTITVDDDDFVDLASGKANAPALFAKGKMKVKGNVMLAQKLSTLFKDQAKL
jgi:3-hydroxyacyl-CoA dehydrogenase/3a,7a,12a-trihydroxy-5b-cholest-24-enoyl-CoA hydratase